MCVCVCVCVRVTVRVYSPLTFKVTQSCKSPVGSTVTAADKGLTQTKEEKEGDLPKKMGRY